MHPSPLKPSEYFNRNIRIGASCIPRADVELRSIIGVDNMMWGSDYPHPEGTWPHTRNKLIEAFAGFPADEVAAMLGENAVRFYGLDRDRLAAIAQRIGPDAADFAT